MSLPHPALLSAPPARDRDDRPRLSRADFLFRNNGTVRALLAYRGSQQKQRHSLAHSYGTFYDWPGIVQIVRAGELSRSLNLPTSACPIDNLS